MVPDGSSRAAAEAILRAVRKLSGAKLVEVSWTWKPIRYMPSSGGGSSEEREFRFRTVRLSPLGEAAREILSETLHTGGAIRWSTVLPELKQRVQRPSAELLQIVEQRLRRAEAAFARWLRDEDAKACAVALRAIHRLRRNPGSNGEQRAVPATAVCTGAGRIDWDGGGR